MTLRSLISFDHALLTAAYSITVQGTYGATNLQSTYGLPGTMMTGASSNGATVSTNGWLYFGASNNSYYTGYVISFADLGLLQNGATQAWIGFRTYASGVAAGSASVVGLNSVGNVTGVGAGITTMLTETQLNRQGAGVTYAQYVECFFDTVALTYQTYVNGIQVASGTIPSGMQYVVFSGQAFSGSYSQYYRDFYFLDVDATKPNARLGPITSTALTASATTSQLPNYANFIATLNGSAAVSVTQSKFGGNSLYTGGGTTAAAVLMPDNSSLRIGSTGDVTYEAWVYTTNIGQNSALFSKDTGSSPFGRLAYAANTWVLYSDSGTAAFTVNANMVVNTWYHIALVRYSGTWYLYQNGVQLATAAGSTLGNNTSQFVIGNNNALASYWQGYIDEFRMSKIARYTAAFTPPSAVFTPDANTLLLFHFDSSSGGYVADHSGVQPSSLQTAQGAAFAMTPFIQNGASNDAMTLNFQSSVPAGQKIVAMQYKMAAQVPFAMNLLASLQESGQPTKTLSTYLFRDVLANYGRDLAGIQALAPDGTAWTAASLATTNLVLQPQSTTAGSTN